MIDKSCKLCGQMKKLCKLCGKCHWKPR